MPRTRAPRSHWTCRRERVFPMTRRKVGILVFPEVEVLDFCGPFEVFSVARLDEDRRRQDPPPYDVLVIAEHPDVVVATGGLKVIPDHGLDDCPPLDVLVVPGGWGTRREMKNDRLIAWLKDTARQVTTLASVCTGSLLLGKAGLLDGKRATTHWRVLEEMRGLFKPAFGCPPGTGTPCTWRSPEQLHRRDAWRPPAAPYRCPPRSLPR